MPFKNTRVPTEGLAGFALGMSAPFHASVGEACRATNYRYAKDHSDLHGVDFDDLPLPALRLLIATFSGELAPYAIPGTPPLNRYYTAAVAH